MSSWKIYYQPETTSNTALVEPSWTYWSLLEQDELHSKGKLDTFHEEGIGRIL